MAKLLKSQKLLFLLGAVSLALSALPQEALAQGSSGDPFIFSYSNDMRRDPERSAGAILDEKDQEKIAQYVQQDSADGEKCSTQFYQGYLEAKSDGKLNETIARVETEFPGVQVRLESQFRRSNHYCEAPFSGMTNEIGGFCDDARFGALLSIQDANLAQRQSLTEQDRRDPRGGRKLFGLLSDRCKFPKPSQIRKKIERLAKDRSRILGSINDGRAKGQIETSTQAVSDSLESNTSSAGSAR